MIVPILLSTGFHTQVDLRRAARNSGIERISIGESLGPDARLAALTRARLEEAGWTPGDGPVVQGAAGSSRADGRADMSRAAELLAEELNTPVHHGFVAAIDPKFHEVVAEHQPKFAATYLLAEGFFAGKMRRDAESTGVPVKVASPLVNAQGGASAAVVAECFIDRMDAAIAQLDAA
ncbi:sirohydrochlorin cobaltochelatase%2C putative [Mycobacterium tuberculosis]|nr:sirohydrochlorin cobaltochelatase%2C putative [Mycobacterium tuberculosis]